MNGEITDEEIIAAVKDKLAQFRSEGFRPSGFMFMVEDVVPLSEINERGTSGIVADGIHPRNALGNIIANVAHKVPANDVVQWVLQAMRAGLSGKVGVHEIGAPALEADELPPQRPH